MIPVPFIANTERDREVLMGQKEVASAYALAEGADLLLVGIGTTVPEAELVTAGMVTPEEMAAIAADGGVGEMLGHFFDAQGRPVETDVTRRIVTLPLDRLRGRRILAVAGGAVKVPAVKAVLESGFLSGLVIDEHTARALGDLMRAEGVHPAATSPATHH